MNGFDTRPPREATQSGFEDHGRGVQLSRTGLSEGGAVLGDGDDLPFKGNVSQRPVWGWPLSPIQASLGVFGYSITARPLNGHAIVHGPSGSRAVGLRVRFLPRLRCVLNVMRAMSIPYQFLLANPGTQLRVLVHIGAPSRGHLMVSSGSLITRHVKADACPFCTDAGDDEIRGPD
jgi:hypothetical protein